MERVDQLSREQMRADLPAFRPGDTVEVHVRIVEGDKERIQVFKGVVIRKRGGLTGASFTVRKVSYGVGVERDSQKRIAVGAGGEMVKRIGTRARVEIERLLEMHVHLALRVKVEPQWSRKRQRIEALGYS